MSFMITGSEINEIQVYTRYKKAIFPYVHTQYARYPLRLTDFLAVCLVLLKAGDLVT